MAKVVSINKYQWNRCEREIMATVLHANGLLGSAEVIERIGHDPEKMTKALIRLLDLGELQMSVDWNLRISGVYK